MQRPNVLIQSPVLCYSKQSSVTLCLSNNIGKHFIPDFSVVLTIFLSPFSWSFEIDGSVVLTDVELTDISSWKKTRHMLGITGSWI